MFPELGAAPLACSLPLLPRPQHKAPRDCSSLLWLRSLPHAFVIPWGLLTEKGFKPKRQSFVEYCPRLLSSEIPFIPCTGTEDPRLPPSHQITPCPHTQVSREVSTPSEAPQSHGTWGASQSHTLQGLPSRPPCYEAATVTRLGWRRTSSRTSGFDPFPGALQVTCSWQEKEVT